jgi:tetratricopeptide (TPR) repeat protein
MTHPLCDLAWKTWDQGDTRRARELMEEHLAAFRHLRTNTGGLAMALGYMIAITTWMGDFQAAEQYVLEKRAIELSFHSSLSAIIVLLDDTGLKFAQGLPSTALADLESALSAARKNSNPLITCWILERLGETLVFEGRVGEGKTRLAESLEIAREKGTLEPFRVPDILDKYANAVLIEGNPQEAQDLYRESLAGSRDSHPRLPGCLDGLAKCAVALGQSERAARLLGAAHRMRETMSLTLLPVYQPAYDQVLSNLRKAINEAAFQQAWESGAAMTATESVDFAIGVE